MKPRHLIKKKENDDAIKWRGHEITRIEAFSDAVFAFAITLMVVSLEVPKTFDELKEMLYGFVPFAICFTLFFQVWVAQNLFFRRFNLHDEWTLVLNAMLLFVVLFFVYPMKFMWSAIFHFQSAFSNSEQSAQLFCIYSAGFAAIYLLLALMYVNAYRKRARLQLTDTESFETITYIYRNLGVAGVGIVGLTFASFGSKYMPFAVGSYCLIGPVVGLTHGKRNKIHRKKFGTGINSAEAEPLIIEEAASN